VFVRALRVDRSPRPAKDYGVAKRSATLRVRRLPRVPLPRQTGGHHEDKTRRPWRERKHKKKDVD
jgi:hypothetical protein